MTSQYRSRAEELVASSFVVQGAELLLSPANDWDRLLFDPLEVTTEVIDDWEAQGLNAMLCPTFCMSTEPHSGVIRQLAAWNSVLHDHSDRLVRIASPADFDEAERSGRIGIIIGLHYGDHIREVDDVDFFYRLGQRNCTIVVRGQNSIGAAHHERTNAGLTQFGIAVVERMNQVGMAVDIAHANDQTSLDVLDVSTQPVYVSHANARALSAHEKNKPDEVLHKIARGGGVIAMQPAATLVAQTEPVYLGQFIDQFEYVAKLVGPEAIALGFEEPWRGWAQLAPVHSPVETVRFKAGEVDDQRLSSTPTMAQVHIDELLVRDRIIVLTAALLERGFSEEDVRGFLGANFRRAFSTIMEPGASLAPHVSAFRAGDTNVGNVAHAR